MIWVKMTFFLKLIKQYKCLIKLWAHAQWKASKDVKFEWCETGKYKITWTSKSTLHIKVLESWNIVLLTVFFLK